MTAVPDLGKMGTSHSRKQNDLTSMLWEWCIDNNMLLTTSHIPGEENTLADAESRKFRKETEWTLDRGILQEAVKEIHAEPQIDLFASTLNYQLRPVVAYQPDPEAIPINAFSISFNNFMFFYAFPPCSIIPKVLKKIQAEEATELLVVPCWQTQPWWPLVIRLLVQKPLVIVGDFNIHVDNPNDSEASDFNSLLSSFGLVLQRIDFPTHRNGHTLDLVISKQCETSLTGIGFELMLSDHAIVKFTISLMKRPHVRKWIMYRKLKSLDHDSFQTCIIDSLASFENSNDLDELVESYTQSLTTALNKHAPQKMFNHCATLRCLVHG